MLDLDVAPPVPVQPRPHDAQRHPRVVDRISDLVVAEWQFCPFRVWARKFDNREAKHGRCKALQADLASAQGAEVHESSAQVSRACDAGTHNMYDSVGGA